MEYYHIQLLLLFNYFRQPLLKNVFNNDCFMNVLHVLFAIIVNYNIFLQSNCQFPKVGEVTSQDLKFTIDFVRCLVQQLNKITKTNEAKTLTH